MDPYRGEEFDIPLGGTHKQATMTSKGSHNNMNQIKFNPPPPRALLSQKYMKSYTRRVHSGTSCLKWSCWGQKQMTTSGCLTQNMYSSHIVMTLVLWPVCRGDWPSIGVDSYCSSPASLITFQFCLISI